LALNAAFRKPQARAHITNTNAPGSIRCRRHGAGATRLVAAARLRPGCRLSCGAFAEASAGEQCSCDDQPFVGARPTMTAQRMNTTT
jgi:hypothetical protein